MRFAADFYVPEWAQGGLPTSTVKLQLYLVAGGYQTEWATDKTSFTAADSFSVTAGAGLQVDFVVSRTP